MWWKLLPLIGTWQRITSWIDIWKQRQRCDDTKKVNEELCDEPKSVDEACKDDHWIQEMKEKLDQIVKNETWELVPRPKQKNVIGTK